MYLLNYATVDIIRGNVNHNIFCSGFTLCTLSCQLMDVNLHRILLFAWVLLFRKLVVTAPMGTNIHGVLVIDGCLFCCLV